MPVSSRWRCSGGEHLCGWSGREGIILKHHHGADTLQGGALVSSSSLQTQTSLPHLMGKVAGSTGWVKFSPLKKMSKTKKPSVIPDRKHAVEDSFELVEQLTWYLVYVCCLASSLGDECLRNNGCPVTTGHALLVLSEVWGTERGSDGITLAVNTMHGLTEYIIFFCMMLRVTVINLVYFLSCALPLR